MRLLTIALAALFFAGAGAAARASANPALEDYLQASFEASNAPGMVAVATDGADIVTVSAYGVDGRGAPMSTTTPLRVASLTKTVTAVAVHQLAEDGLIGLDDPVVEHLPELELSDERYTAITVQQLLDNRSGMHDAQFDLNELNASDSLQDYVSRLTGATLASAPGTAEAYCNVNWEVLARMVEVVTGQPYDAYLRQRVFEPLGMTSSTVDVRQTDAPGGYQEVFGLHVARVDDVLFSAGSGSNGLVTTADDLARWVRWIATGYGIEEVLSPETRQAMVDRAVDEGGANGLEAGDGRAGKSGMQMTEMSYLRMVPDAGTGAAVVVNDSDLAGPAYAIADGALDVLAGKDPDPAGSGWQLVVIGYLLASALSIAAALRGIRRAATWAVPRREAPTWLTAPRLGWLLLPAIVLVAIPSLARWLTNGERTLTWLQASYLLLTPMLVLLVMALSGGSVLVARLLALRSVSRDGQAGGEQLAGGEPEDCPRGVAEVRG